MGPMIKVSVLYPNQPGVRFDHGYYFERHLPQVRQLVGAALKGVAVDQGISSPESPAPYLVMCHLWFDSLESFQTVMAQHGLALLADIPNYTDAQPVIQVSEVRIADEPARSQAAG